MTAILKRPSRVKVNVPGHSRRQFIKAGLAEIAMLAAGSMAFPSIIKADSMRKTNSKFVVNALAKALRSIGSPVCITAAMKLETEQNDSENVYFYLRRAGLNSSDALIIAHALKSLQDDSLSALASMSLSYNDAIGDAGTIAMMQALPPSIRELGLVNCGIGDAGGEAILQWARHATGLRIMCIEENHMSEELKFRLSKLTQKNAALWVVV